MTNQSQSSPANVGRLTGFILGLVVFVCVTMIGIAGYLKFELDNAQRVLAAPETAEGSDQELLDKLRRSLSYSGFIGLAQTFTTTHDASLIPDMKARLKAAQEIIDRLPDKTPRGAQQDLIAILAVFDAAQKRAEKSLADPVVTFNSTDMAPLFAALPVIDTRIAEAAASSRLTAQTELQFWAMMLMFVAWSSLIIASSCAAGIYLALRSRNSAPLRALAQSVKNMSRGDMKTPIWGMERTDSVGELARTVDLARYHFSQLPDMSLLSDQGPVRIRFEGNTRSLFEAMMQLITKDSEDIRNQTRTLTSTISDQQNAIMNLSSKVESLLHDILSRGQDGNQQIKQVLNDTLGSAQMLKSAQESATHHLKTIIPYMQERAQGLADIAQITGKQVAQALQSLTMSEHNLKASAEQSQIAITKLSTTADDLGGRMFGAVNLLQASGKVLAETTESTQSRLNEAIERLNKTIEQPTMAVDYVSKLEGLIRSLEGANKALEQRVSEHTEAAQKQVEFLTINSTSLLAQTTSTAETLSKASEHLREEQLKLDMTMGSISTKLDDLGNKLEIQAHAAFGKTETAVGQSQGQIAELVAQVGELAQRIGALSSTTESASRDPAFANNLLIEIKAGFETTVRSLGQMREQMTKMVISSQPQGITIPIPLDDTTKEQLQEVAAQIEATRTGLTQLIIQQIERVETRLADFNRNPETPAPALSANTQEQMEQQTQILTELVATMGILDAHMQQLKSEMKVARG